MNKLSKYPNRKRLLYVLILIGSLLILFSRRPDAFLNPQFWAEDGKVWYQDAYNDGFLLALLTPVAGYFQTISRLVAGFSQFFPFEYAPAIFNLSAITAKLLVVFFLFSKRLERLFPSQAARALTAFIYLALPHSYETHANLTNVQWHLALLGFLILIAVPAASKTARIFDYSIIGLSALSGPFCLLLLPVAAVKYWFERDRNTLVLLSILAGGCLIQGVSLLVNERPTRAPLGASLKLFLKIVGGHWFVSSTVGEAGFAWTLERPFWKDGIAVIINLGGFALLAYAFEKSALELRLLIIFALLMVASTLIAPAISSDSPQWKAMLFADVASRYWLIPIFCFLVSFLWLALSAPHKMLRLIAAGLLLISSVGIYKDWKYQPYVDYEFQKYAAEFNRAAPGREVVIPINPNWEMRPVKK